MIFLNVKIVKIWKHDYDAKMAYVAWVSFVTSL